MDSNGSGVAASGRALKDYADLKRTSASSSRQEASRRSPASAAISGGREEVYSTDDRDGQRGSALLSDTNGVDLPDNCLESPRSEGSGDSLEIGGRAMLVSTNASLDSMDTLELAQLYLQRKRTRHDDESSTALAGQSPFSDSGVVDSPSLRTLGDGAEAVGDTLLVRPTETELDAIRDQLRHRDQTLELAARVGQELLERNAVLESDLLSQSSSRDQLQRETSQLQHEITVKEHLLKIYYAEMEDEDERAEALHKRRASSRSSFSPPARACLSPVRSLSSMSNISEEAAQMLQVECEELRAANKLLDEEASLLHQQAALLDQREQELITECVRRLNEATENLGQMQLAYQQREEVADQHANEIADLHSTNERMKSAYTALSDEKLLLQSELEQMAARQSTMCAQVSELQEQYMECLNLFREAQGELALYRKHASMPNNFMTPTQAAMPRQESIGSELSAAMRQHAENSSSPELAGNGRMTPPPPVHKEPEHSSLQSQPAPMPPTTPQTSATRVGFGQLPHHVSPLHTPVKPVASSSTEIQFISQSVSQGNTPVSSPVSSSPSSSSTTGVLSSRSDPFLSTTPLGSSFVSGGGVGMGASTTPKNNPSPLVNSRTYHANQIMSAVRSLDHHQAPRTVGGVYHRNQTSGPPTADVNGSAPPTPAASRRQSLASEPLHGITAPHTVPSSSAASRIYTAPEKLRIVKPMEGSLTLLKWKLLALQQHSGADVLQQALAIPGIHQKGDDSVPADRSGEQTPTAPVVAGLGAVAMASSPISSSAPPSASMATATGAVPAIVPRRLASQVPRVYRSPAFSSPSARPKTPPTSLAGVDAKPETLRTDPAPQFSIGDQSSTSASPVSSPESSPISPWHGTARQASVAGTARHATAPAAAVAHSISSSAPSSTMSTPASHTSATTITASETPRGSVLSRFSRFPTFGLGNMLSGFSGGRGLAAMSSPPSVRSDGSAATGQSVADAGTDIDGDVE